MVTFLISVTNPVNKGWSDWKTVAIVFRKIKDTTDPIYLEFLLPRDKTRFPYICFLVCSSVTYYCYSFPGSLFFPSSRRKEERPGNEVVLWLDYFELEISGSSGRLAGSKLIRKGCRLPGVPILAPAFTENTSKLTASKVFPVPVEDAS